MHRTVEPVRTRRGIGSTVGTVLGMLLILSGIAGMAAGHVPASPDASVLPAVQLLLGTAVLVRFTMGGSRTPHRSAPAAARRRDRLSATGG